MVQKCFLQEPRLPKEIPLCDRLKRTRKTKEDWRQAKKAKSSSLGRSWPIGMMMLESSWSLCEGFISPQAAYWEQARLNAKPHQCSPPKGEIAAQPQWLFPPLSPHTEGSANGARICPLIQKKIWVVQDKRSVRWGTMKSTETKRIKMKKAWAH